MCRTSSSLRGALRDESASELKRQMTLLDDASGPIGAFPTILGAPPYRFGAPDKRVLATWRELAASGLHVDLVYAPAAFETLLQTMDDRPQCYVHCGGNAGVATQLNGTATRGSWA